jgi:trehalose synthase
MRDVPIESNSVGRLGEVLSDEDCRRTADALARLREGLAGKRMWHINSTASGGGVAEILTSLLPYERDADVDVRWLVIDGTDEFFEITKRIHHRLHEAEGDGGALGDAERAVYDETLAPAADDLADRVAPGDIVMLHDPQTAALVAAARRAGAHVIWRCHVGVDTPGALAHAAWDFLADDVRAADRCVFSRPPYVWDGLDPARVTVLAPCIDVLSPKNHPMAAATSRSLLSAAGIVRSNGHRPEPDGTSDWPAITTRARMTEDEPLPAGAPFVLQVSRWDPLKDHEGVLSAFVEYCAPDVPDVHLVLAGPDTDGVDDDPEGRETFDHLIQCWRSRSPSVRRRVHLASLPMEDATQNAVMVNALQHQADVVAQKSLAEGFGLTVAEAMWKRRPIAASRVGGIQDQVVDGTSGVLVEPLDLASFGAAVTRFLTDGGFAERMAGAAHRRVCDCFLPLHHFEGEAALVEAVRA